MENNLEERTEKCSWKIVADAEKHPAGNLKLCKTNCEGYSPVCCHYVPESLLKRNYTTK